MGTQLMNLSYYKINKLLWYWSKEDGAHIVRNVSLSLDRAPPAREEPKRPPAATPKKPKPQAGDGLANLLELHARFKTWMETPDPPKTPKLPKPVEQEETAPPFDIQEIPAAMRKIHLPKSAALMERWFAGRLNYSPTDVDEAKEINQEGKPYPPDMYDTTTIKLDWIFKFPRAKEKFDYLINEAIRSERAIKKLEEKLISYKGKVVDLFPAELCKEDPVMLHRHFQFQFAWVDGTFAQKINLLLTSQWERSGAPDDLTGAIGSFNFYAAIGHANYIIRCSVAVYGYKGDWYMGIYKG
jgi:hypothetical protein